MDSKFLTPEQVAVFSNAFGGSEKEASIQEQLALAQALRGNIGKQHHTTGLGGLFGAVGDALNGYASKKAYDSTQGQRGANFDAHKAAYQLILDQLNKSGRLSQMFGGQQQQGAPDPYSAEQAQYAPLNTVPDSGSYT